MTSTPWRYDGALRRPRAVAVVGDDDELQSGARRRGGDVIDRAGTIRTPGVDVDGAARAGWHSRGDRQRLPRGRQRERHDRRRDDDDRGDDAT